MSTLPDRVRRSYLTCLLRPHSAYHSLTAGDDATHCKECQSVAKTTQPTFNSDLPPESAKIKKILSILKMIDERSEGVEKTIIFSQFTTMLDLIEPFLDADGVKHVRCTYIFVKFCHSIPVPSSLCVERSALTNSRHQTTVLCPRTNVKLVWRRFGTARPRGVY